MNQTLWVRIALLSFLTAFVVIAPRDTHAQGNAQRGAQVFEACTAYHSLKSGVNMTGPSLSGLWGRKAGRLASFERYSPALKTSGVTWDANTLEPWLKSPEQFIPGNWMTFPGIPEAKTRADLLAFLKEAAAGKVETAVTENGGMGAMMGGMAPHFSDLKKLAPERQVRSIRSCHDSYFVTSGDGQTRAFWDHSLRFETDASALGPAEGAPAILPAGMMGDRATIVFAKPEEISPFIKHQC